jgi:iron-regulated transporter 1
LSCLVFLVFARFGTADGTRLILFSTLVVLACPEKLASIANTVAVERDWVSVLVYSSPNDGIFWKESVERLTQIY